MTPSALRESDPSPGIVHRRPAPAPPDHRRQIGWIYPAGPSGCRQVSARAPAKGPASAHPLRDQRAAAAKNSRFMTAEAYLYRVNGGNSAEL
jgi:hypothetical protein